MDTGTTPTTTATQSPLVRYLIAAGLSVLAAVISGLAYYFWPAGLTTPPTPPAAAAAAPLVAVEAQPEPEKTPAPARVAYQKAAPRATISYQLPTEPAALPAPRPTVTSTEWDAAEARFDALLGDLK